ncbi:MAG: A/G-specific adenine glycosylase [Thermoanaerobaculum sp.]
MGAEALVTWFWHRRRPFPWRTPFPRDPYLVVVSEVMLQQTQAARVAEFLPAFLARFPTLEALASAPEEEVVAAFAGLGYYRRARLLHRLARAVGKDGWPQEPETLAKLPGLGPYTAAAVAAFSFGKLSPPVDGNLARIAARVLALDLPVGSPPLKRQAAAFAAGLATQAGTPEIFEALMELGATVCTPRRPQCPVCPLAPSCQALARGTPTAFPRPKPRRPPEAITWVALWVENPRGEVLLRQIQDPPLAGLWLPPLDRGEGEILARAQALAAAAGSSVEPTPWGSVRHHITHRRITVALFRVPAVFAARETANGWRWARPEAFGATSSLAGKLARLAQNPALPTELP